MTNTAVARVETRGRPSIYTRELADEICARLATGESLRAICRSEGMPAESTVRYWALDDNLGFFAQYHKAREVGYERMAEDIIEMADNPRIARKITERSDGSMETVTTDAVDRARLQVETRKWLMSKALPKIYGDRLPAAGGVVVNVNVMERATGARRVLLASLDDLADGRHLIEGTAEDVEFGS